MGTDVFAIHPRLVSPALFHTIVKDESSQFLTVTATRETTELEDMIDSESAMWEKASGTGPEVNRMA